MEKQVKPENLFIGRKKWLAALAAAVFIILGLFIGISGPIALFKYPPEDGFVMPFLLIIFPVFAVYLILVGVMNFRNLFFPYVLTSDEKGIYNYSGLFHYGFISWEDIGAFSNISTILDFLDNETPCLRAYVRDMKKYKSGLPFGKKWLLFWGGGSIKIFTLCSQIKKRVLYSLLENARAYYTANDEPTVENER